jgi:hypothetical protein
MKIRQSGIELVSFPNLTATGAYFGAPTGCALATEYVSSKECLWNAGNGDVLDLKSLARDSKL